MQTEIKILASSDKAILLNVADGIFDHGIDINHTVEFLEDPRHHLAVAIDDGLVVGFASGVHYIHPDKEPELWINEVGIASTHRNRGLAKRILQALLDVGRGLGCKEAWVLTDRANIPAMQLYTSLGGVEAPKDQVMFTFHFTKKETK